MSRMIGVAEAIVLALVVLWLARGARLRPASPIRMATIAGWLVAQALLVDLFVLRWLPAAWQAPGAGAGTVIAPGVVWLVLAARASLVIAAFILWLAISRERMSGLHAWLLALALFASAIPRGTMPVLGLAGLVWLTRRPDWTCAFSGRLRLAVLVTAPLLLALLSLWPQAVVSASGARVRIVPLLIFSGLDPLVGSLPAWLAQEMTLARPLDLLARALLQLFRAQLAVLTVRAVTMPIRLYGMSLRRRFMVNYAFLRTIPNLLATLTMLAVLYVAFGVLEASRAREAFECTLARADAAAAALLLDPRTAQPGPAAAAALESARGWLGPEGAGAHLVLRGGDGAAPLATAGTPASLVAESWPVSSRARRGALEAGPALYLFAHRSGGSDSTRSIEVFVPLDTTTLSMVARTVGARLTLSIVRGFSNEGVGLRPIDLASRDAVRVVGAGGGPRRARALFLERTYLPLGDWSEGGHRDENRALVLELHATGTLLAASLRRIPGWLASNGVMLALLVALITVFGFLDGLAVRSGRAVVRSIEEEVGSLREAARRFGSGELAHRIPVRGKDELSGLAGSFNEMASNLERQRTELIEKERMDEDLEVALAIQRRFLPQRPPSVPGLDVAGVSVPSREVGGDLFHYLELPEGRLAVALGDVSGKSVPAALIMSNVMAALRAEVQHEVEVEKSMERVNRLLGEQIEPGRFVTLFYGIVDPKAGRLRYTSAGHNPVLKIDASGAAGWLKEGGVPLGIEPDSRYPSAECPLERGDLLVVYSDGVTEAEGPASSEGRSERVPLFGEARLVEVATAARKGSAAEVVEAVLAAVKRFAGERPQADDITLVVVRRT